MNILFTSIVGSAAIASLVVTIISIYNQNAQKSAYFNLLSIAVTCYTAGNFLDFISLSEDAAIAAVKMSYLGIPFIPPLWYLCVREFCGQPVKKLTSVMLIMIIPLVTVILAYTWESNHLLFSGFWYESNNYLSQLRFTEGPFYLVKQLYLHFLNLLGLVTIVSSYRRGSKKVKKQIIFFAISALIPFFNTVTLLSHVDSYAIDLSPIALSYTMVLFFISIKRYGVHNYSVVIKENIVENLPDGIVFFDKDSTYMDSNKAAKEIFYQLKETLIGTELNKMHFLPFDSFSSSQDKSIGKEFSKEHGDIIRTYNAVVSSIKNSGDFIGYVVVISNITPIKNLVSELELKAHTDPLTEIYNRGFFFEKSNYEINKAKLAKNRLSLIIFDLDFFKKINDQYGHQCGDYVLKLVAQIGLQNLRKTDIFGRYGGEEFCVLLLNTSLEGAAIKAETLREKIQAHTFEYANEIIRVTASFGIAELNAEFADEAISELLKRADENLYKAKINGRNRVQF